jgi:hypothetical protein
VNGRRVGDDFKYLRFISKDIRHFHGIECETDPLVGDDFIEQGLTRSTIELLVFASFEEALFRQRYLPQRLQALRTLRLLAVQQFFEHLWNTNLRNCNQPRSTIKIE